MSSDFFENCYQQSIHIQIIFIVYTCINRGGRGVMVIVVGNGYGDTSSGRG